MDGEWAVKEREERRKAGKKCEVRRNEERKDGSINEVKQPRASDFG